MPGEILHPTTVIQREGTSSSADEDDDSLKHQLSSRLTSFLSNHHDGASLFIEDVREPRESSDEGSSDEEGCKSADISIPRPTVRIYYLDWIRIVAIYLVVAFHVVQALRWIGLWEGAEKEHATIYMVYSLQIGMPLFFHISGRAQALARPLSLARGLWQRLVRLLVPYLVCQAVLVPPWMYVHMRDDHPGKWSNIFAFLWWYWHPSNFIYDPAWLWFLVVLFLISVFNAPLFLYAEKGHVAHAAMFIVAWLMLGLLLCIVLPFSPLFALCAGTGPLVALFLVANVPLQKMGEDTKMVPKETVVKQWCCCRLITAVHIAAMVGLVCSFRYADLGNEVNVVSLFPMLLCFNSFYTQGYFVVRWLPKDERLRAEDMKNHVRRTQIYQVPAVFFILVALSWGSPTGEWELPIYPVYSASYKDQPTFAIAHVLGTWAFIAASLWSCQAYLDHEIDARLYEHASKSTIIVYIFHWVFLKPFVWWVIRDMGLTSGPFEFLAVILSFSFSVAGALCVYMILCRVPSLGMLFGL